MPTPYRLSDFPGVNYNRDLTTAGFNAATRALNIDFVSGGGITPRPAFRTLLTSGTSEWYTWCGAVRDSYNLIGLMEHQTALVHDASFNSSIILRTPQSGSTNLWAVSQTTGTTIASMTLGGTSATSRNRIRGGLSLTDEPIAGYYVVAAPTGELATFRVYYAFSAFTALTAPASGSYVSGGLGSGTHVAVLPQSRRLLVAQGQRVWFSDPDAVTFTSGNYFNIAPYGTGTFMNDPISGLISSGNNVYIFTPKNLYMVYGETTDSNGNAIIQYRRIASVGCTAPYYGITKDKMGRVYFLGGGGLYTVDGASVTRIQLPFEYVWQSTPYAIPGLQTQRDVLGTNASSKDLHYFPYEHLFDEGIPGAQITYSNIGVHVSSRKLFVYAISPDLGADSSTALSNCKGGTWVLDLPTNKWAYWDISPRCMTSGFEALNSSGNYQDVRDSVRERYYFTSSGAGLTNWSAKTLVRSDPTQSADSPGNISCEYWSGYDGLGSPGVNKKIDSIRIWGMGSTGSPLTVETYCDFETTFRGASGTYSCGTFSGASSSIGYKIIDVGSTGSCFSFRLYRSASTQAWHVGAVDIFSQTIGTGGSLTARSSDDGGY